MEVEDHDERAKKVINTYNKQKNIASRTVAIQPARAPPRYTQSPQREAGAAIACIDARTSRLVRPRPGGQAAAHRAQNIHGDYNDRVALDDKYHALLANNRVDICCSLDTWVSAETKDASQHIPGYRKKVQLTRYINPPIGKKRGKQSGGIITNIHTRVQPLVSSFMETIDNRYVNQMAIHCARLVFVFVYNPPIKSANEEFTDPNRWRITQQNMSDVARIATFCKQIGYDMIPMGDWNTRRGHLTDDHDDNVMFQKL